MATYRKEFFEEHSNRDGGAGLFAVHSACIAAADDGHDPTAALHTSFRHVEDFVDELKERVEELVPLLPDDDTLDPWGQLDKLRDAAGALLLASLGKSHDSLPVAARRFISDDVVDHLKETLELGLWMWIEIQRERDKLERRGGSNWPTLALSALLNRKGTFVNTRIIAADDESDEEVTA